ncbi:MAG: SusD/RagB family nutrient-binding outer membrane lipoprotein [Chryseolinea sp.]
MKPSIYILCLGLVFASCDQGFEEMNINPNASKDVIPEYLFTDAQLTTVNTNYTGGAYLTIGQSMQHFATYKEVPAAGDKYFNYSYSTGNWGAFTAPVIQIGQVIGKVADDPNAINKLAAARIWKVYLFHRLTDLYGDIPYFNAANALASNNFTPVYDSQADIYNDLFKELDEAIASFDPAKATFGNSDLLFAGDITKWKKFAYSLMLRLGMRLTKVNASLAEQMVKKAIAGGVIVNDTDLASIVYINGTQTATRNFIASGMMSTDYGSPGGDNVEGGKFAKTLIDYLKTTGDPRLNVVSIVWMPTGSNSYVADTTTALQLGMQNAKYNSLPAEFNTFSEPNPATVLRYDTPLVVIGPAEMNLLLAEAAVRGWYSDASAADSYSAAVRSAMKQWSLFGSAGVISDAKVNKYLVANPYVSGSDEQQIEQIQTQKWVSMMFEDEYEIYASWRRTGYPTLTPTNYPGNLTGGKIPTRFVIPDSELLYNQENFVTARDRQTGNNSFSSTVWWDVD